MSAFTKPELIAVINKCRRAEKHLRDAKRYEGKVIVVSAAEGARRDALWSEVTELRCDCIATIKRLASALVKASPP